MIRTTVGEDYLVGVLGAGAMGRGIAQVAAQGGFNVRLADTKSGAAGEGKSFIVRMLNRAAEKGRLAEDEAEAAINRIQIVDGVSALKDCDLVIETVFEDLDVKRKVFADLEEVCSEDTVLASNTSALPIIAISAKCRHPGRIAGMHFSNPVPRMRLVEVIYTPRTDPAVIDLLTEVGRRMGRTPITVKDGPAFLVGNNARAFYTEGLRLHQEHIGTPAEIDRIVRDAGGYRMGPFELMDHIGIDVNYAGTKSLFEDSFNDPRYRPSADYRLMVEAGMFGRKTGQGFYHYDDDSNPVIEPEPAPPTGRPDRVWLWGYDKTAHRRLVDLAGRAAVPVEAGKRPSVDAVALVAPLAQDATAAALALATDPRRTVAVDGLFGWEKRRTVMAPPGADETAVAAAIGLLASDGVPVTRVNDSPGFVMPRLQAVITNLASDLCQHRVAAPDEVDIGMKLAFNFPEGPLEAGDRLGADVILSIIDELHQFYGDDRYRPSPWLTRRARLGLSLKTPERGA